MHWLLDWNAESWDGGGRRRQSHRPSLSLRIEDRVGAYRVFALVVSAMCKCKATRSSYSNVDKGTSITIINEFQYTMVAHQ